MGKGLPYSHERGIFIGGSPFEGGGVNYSTDEQDTGLTWVDGKPVYQKTISGTMNPTSPTTIAHGISNFDELVSMEGSIERGSGTGTWLSITSTEHPSVASEQILKSVNSTNIILADSGSLFDNSKVYITVRYTKTTD